MMTTADTVRRRRALVTAESVPLVPAGSPATPRESLYRPIRYYAVWTARVLLPIVYLLSIAKPVVIDSSTSERSIPQSTAVLVVTHSRADYLATTLTSLLTHHPNNADFPIVVSQDMQDQEHESVTNVIKTFAKRAASSNQKLFHFAHAKSYEDNTGNETFINTIAYRRITRHYHYALSRLFRDGLDGSSIDRVIILEDDMEIAPDFFSYFQALTPMLESDPSLLCVSAWNDNGIDSLALNHTQLHRTDFFPGLGWMLTRSLWNELEPKWPEKFWDDWLRKEEQTQGRHCVRPEVSRTSNFGEKGVSQSFHFDKHVAKVVHATTEQAVDFMKMDLSYLNAALYDHMIFSRMSNAVQLRFSNYLSSRPQDSDVIAFYPPKGIQAIGKRTGIMIDDRNGVRRTSYNGVIVIPWNNHWAFIVQRGWEPPEGYTMGSSVCC